MNIGMLWFDNDAKRTFDEKVQRAADYFQKKYNRMPTMCFVHPSMLPANVETVNNIKILTYKYVIPNHFWIGDGSNEKLQVFDNNSILR